MIDHVVAEAGMALGMLAAALGNAIGTRVREGTSPDGASAEVETSKGAAALLVGTPQSSLAIYVRDLHKLMRKLEQAGHAKPGLWPKGYDDVTLGLAARDAGARRIVRLTLRLGGVPVSDPGANMKTD